MSDPTGTDPHRTDMNEYYDPMLDITHLSFFGRNGQAMQAYYDHTLNYWNVSNVVGVLTFMSTWED